MQNNKFANNIVAVWLAADICFNKKFCKILVSLILSAQFSPYWLIYPCPESYSQPFESFRLSPNLLASSTWMINHDFVSLPTYGTIVPNVRAHVAHCLSCQDTLEFSYPERALLTEFVRATLCVCVALTCLRLELLRLHGGTCVTNPNLRLTKHYWDYALAECL